MKTFELFLDQIRKTSDRGATPWKTNEPGANDRVYDQVSRLKTLGAKPDIMPSQVHYYLKNHALDVNKFISNKLFQERIIKGDDILDVNYLAKGMAAAQAVCRIHIVLDTGEEGFGTGFLVAPNILMTNNHVLPDHYFASHAYAEFNYEKGKDDIPLSVKVHRFDPDKLFYTNEALDFSIVWVNSQASDGSESLGQFGYLKLNPQLGKIKEDDYVSIIQHPDGEIKKVTLRGNRITNLSLPKFIRYLTDTKNGSSGAPVFNDYWEVVALHHAGIPKYDDDGKILNLSGGLWDRSQGELQIDWLENEGVRVSSIVYDITTKACLQFPLLMEFFAPITDLEIIQKAIGLTPREVEAEHYYPQATDETDRQQYYQEIDNVQSAGYSEWQNLLEKTHTKHHHYNPSKYVYPKVDIHSDGLLRSIYSGKTFTVQELQLADESIDIARRLRFMALSKSAGRITKERYQAEIKALEAALPYNCEHVVCQSWFDEREPMRGDLHHLFACESRCNSFRNNHPYYDFEGYEPTPLVDVEKEMATCGNMEDNKFEPENNKGIVARATLYFMLRYPQAITVYNDENIEMLKSWSKEQPVTLYEKHRNREIFLLQGNRNPFIDFPDLANRLNFQSNKESRPDRLSARLDEKVIQDNIAIEVKKAILTRYGYPNPNPNTLSDEKAMVDFEFSNNQYLSLTARFNEVAETYYINPAKISASEVVSCILVKDCIDLVKQAGS